LSDGADPKGVQGTGFFRGLLAGAIVAVLLLATIAPLREAILPADSAEDRVGQAIDVIDETYFRQPDSETLQDASIEGMVRRLKRENDDRFSHYFDAETYERFSAATDGQFSGVGMTVSEVKQGLRVARVYEGTPAQGAGIETGDLITAVDGRSIAGESSTASAAEIKGPPGSEVTLTVKDPESGKSEDLTLERASVKVPAVTGELRRRGGRKIAYVGLATFSRGAHAELRAKVEELYEKGAEGLVLDLRGNGGGLLDEAVLVESIFQEDGPVVITEGRTRPRQTLEAKGDALAARPMAVLTNRDTASSSEIVTAALKENGIATVVGTRTFGKGTFQEVIELDGGAALDLTVGEYLTADGSSILGTGVKPDIRVSDDDPADGDSALDRALGVVAGQLNGN
jgi:carboxyl-terminal processing protease